MSWNRFGFSIKQKFADPRFLLCFTVINYCIFLLYYSFLLIFLQPVGIAVMLFAEADAAAAVDKLFYLGEAATDLLLVALIASAAVTAYSAVKERSVRSAFYAFAMFPLILSKLSILVYFAANALS